VIETTTSLGTGSWQPASGVEFRTVADLGEAVLINAFILATSDALGFYRLRIVVGP